MPPRVSLILFGLLALGCSQPKHRPPRLPLYGVGTTQETFIDTSRPTPANGEGYPELPQRTLNADVWYPALADTDAGDSPEATLDLRGAPFPLVVFVHGSQGLSVQSTFLMHALASHGYVVVAANHPLTYLLTPGGPSDKHCDLEVGDVSFIATQMFALSGNARSELAGALDPAAGFAVVGHSTGGAVTLAAAFGPHDHDDRIKAAVALAPDACFFSESFFHTRSLPMMVIAGTNDGYVPAGSNAVKAFQLALGPKRLALLAGGNHLSFTDVNMPDQVDTPDSNDSDITQAFVRAEGSAGDCSMQAPIGTLEPMPFETQHTLTNQLATAFLDAYLYQDSSGLAAIDAAPPALVDWRK